MPDKYTTKKFHSFLLSERRAHMHIEFDFFVLFLFLFLFLGFSFGFGFGFRFGFWIWVQLSPIPTLSPFRLSLLCALTCVWLMDSLVYPSGHNKGETHTRTQQTHNIHPEHTDLKISNNRDIS